MYRIAEHRVLEVVDVKLLGMESVVRRFAAAAGRTERTAADVPGPDSNIPHVRCRLAVRR